MKEVITKIPNSSIYTFPCPGCHYNHHLDISEWQWNGDLVKPTASPSLLVNKIAAGGSPRCHFFIREGRLVYLSDCTHDLAGQTVDMVPGDCA